MGLTVRQRHSKLHINRGVDTTDTYSAQNTYYAMSYHLGHTEDDIDMKKAVNKAQEYHNAQEKRECVRGHWRQCRRK
jgi:hypothetical protein